MKGVYVCKTTLDKIQAEVQKLNDDIKANDLRKKDDDRRRYLVIWFLVGMVSYIYSLYHILYIPHVPGQVGIVELLVMLVMVLTCVLMPVGLVTLIKIHMDTEDEEDGGRDD